MQRCGICRLWPETKIILLFERASSADYQNWQASEIDGCIPLSVSPDVLIGTLRQILEGNLKILVQEAASLPVIALPSARLPIVPVVTREEARNDAFDGTFSMRVRHGLSEREDQVLRDLVKGLPNRMIARKRDMAEAVAPRSDRLIGPSLAAADNGGKQWPTWISRRNCRSKCATSRILRPPSRWRSSGGQWPLNRRRRSQSDSADRLRHGESKTALAAKLFRGHQSRVADRTDARRPLVSTRLQEARGAGERRLRPPYPW